MSFGKFGVDNGQCKIQEEKRSNEHNQHEVEVNYVGISFLKHNLNITPAFQSNALKHGKHGI